MLILFAAAMLQVRELKHDPVVTPTEVSITGECRGHTIVVRYNNDWRVSGKGRFVAIAIDNRDIMPVVATLNERLEGRHIEKVSLLTCDAADGIPFSVAISPDKQESIARSMKDYIGAAIYPDHVLIEK